LTGDDLDIIVNKCPNVRKIKLENNNIDNFSNINKLLGLNLKKINVKGNPFIECDNNYKNKLFNTFLSLICIDNYDKEGNDIESTEYGDGGNYYEEEERTEKIESFDENSLNNENIDSNLEEEQEEEEDDDEGEGEIENNNNNNKENI
jgi:hypothetical protein